MFKKIFLFILFLTIDVRAFAHDDHPHHVKHNMVLFGQKEIFVSHIVYKVPHNFQVILKVNFDTETEALYLAERARHPQQQFIYLLDTMDIKEINEVASISGEIFRFDESGKKIGLAKNVKLSRENFTVVYFDEVPLSLAP